MQLINDSVFPLLLTFLDMWSPHCGQTRVNAALAGTFGFDVTDNDGRPIIDKMINQRQLPYSNCVTSPPHSKTNYPSTTEDLSTFQTKEEQYNLPAKRAVSPP